MLLSVSFFRGVGVRMVEPLYQSPSFDGVLPSLVFLQVLYPNDSQNDGESWYKRAMDFVWLLDTICLLTSDVCRHDFMLCRTFPL